MSQHKMNLDECEVSGESVLAVVDGMGVFKSKAREILAERGISNPVVGEWYSLKVFLEVFAEIAKTIGPKTLFLIGSKIPENANFPPHIDSIEKALQSIDVAYHMNHRFRGSVMFDSATEKKIEGIGCYKYEKMGDKKARLICNNPYPCDFDRGIIEAMAKRFKPSSSYFVTVGHDVALPCRKNDGESCSYIVEW